MDALGIRRHFRVGGEKVNALAGPGTTSERGNPDGEEGRDETPSERSDRNWGEILQEFRVTQTGTQIISGFLLTLAFQPRFTRLDEFQLAVYVCLVVLAAITTAVGLAPVSLHRALFRRHKKTRTVKIANLLLILYVILVSLLTAGVVLFIVDAVVNLTAGLIAGVAMLVLLFVLLVALPLAVRGQRSAPAEPPEG